ncbi:hypothetical protein EVAR_21871_1 [Eumeta japonica]|uniref:Uncharacterized protein n=1 Tax=Eumeta variegata TaxID=151549 RepID=A0A4C1VB28_EUMVA|nr:hypothetical protein EVAR_21871_1 [Eumeta japonica]
MSPQERTAACGRHLTDELGTPGVSTAGQKRDLTRCSPNGMAADVETDKYIFCCGKKRTKNIISACAGSVRLAPTKQVPVALSVVQSFHDFP